MIGYIIPDANFISLLVFMYMPSIRVAVLCVILVGFVIADTKQGAVEAIRIADFPAWASQDRIDFGK